ncbi:hypothetical protein [Mycolicibacter kumamotonensis]|uniref:Uncharacterized protein n=1 Tax=Mycolicibacter kumamotonensis TaxID=354243 RepID=A0A7K3LHF2_9MYCO|nr:hypothetical protein [Mycolicibacter kumamotonensis]NDJ91787.1 hypothetical protein [Mycolicibacter kumamotonensis]
MAGKSGSGYGLLAGAVAAAGAVVAAVPVSAVVVSAAVIGTGVVAGVGIAKLRAKDADSPNDVAGGIPADGWSQRAVVVQFNAKGLASPGVLKQMGYQVGRNGDGPSRRRRILESVYEAKLTASSADERDYILQWGPPASRARARKMERALAGFLRNAKHKNADMSEAIADWEEDLAWLRQHYQL